MPKKDHKAMYISGTTSVTCHEEGNFPLCGTMAFVAPELVIDEEHEKFAMADSLIGLFQSKEDYSKSRWAGVRR